MTYMTYMAPLVSFVGFILRMIIMPSLNVLLPVHEVVCLGEASEAPEIHGLVVLTADFNEQITTWLSTGFRVPLHHGKGNPCSCLSL